MSSQETELHRTAWRVVDAVMPGSEFISHEVDLAGEDQCAVRFPEPVILQPVGCKTCGDPPELVGLTTKCRDLHEICQCGQRFDQPKAKSCRRRKHAKEEK